MIKLDLTKPAERLQARWSARPAFPIKSRGPIIALDWDGPTLRAAQAARRGDKAEIVQFAAQRLDGAMGLAEPDFDPQAAGASLARALQQLKLKPGAVVMGIPRGLVFLRTLSLPKPATPAELAAMVYFQISKDLPFRPEDAVIDFQVDERPGPAAPPALPTGPGEQPPAEPSPAPAVLDLLVAVVKKDVVELCRRTAEAAGFRLAALGLDSYANLRGLAACRLENRPRTVALVSLRQEEVLIDVIAGESLAFSRTAPLGRDKAVAASEAGPEPGAALERNKPRVSRDQSPATAAPAPGLEAGLLDTILIEVVRSLHNYGAPSATRRSRKSWSPAPAGGKGL